MYQQRLQCYECDECHALIPKSQPVRFHDGRHYCSPECQCAYLDRIDERRAQNLNRHEEWEDVSHCVGDACTD